MDAYRVKLADTVAEREQVHALNYATFVEEIPQHAPDATRRLVDRVDAENEYVVAVDATGEVVGMLALRDQRPFSLDRKLDDLDALLPPHRSVCEVRLLAVRPRWRHRRVFRDLLVTAARRCLAAGHDLAVISGTTRQLELYAHIGFEAFGPLVGAADARFQPMVLAVEAFLARFGDAVGRPAPGRRAASFLTGPVPLQAGVGPALAAAPVSHRSEDFRGQLQRVRKRLCALTGASRAAVMVGSGTLANDAIAASLAASADAGLVLANGEFGERLVDHARRAGLRFDVVRQPWGEAFDPILVAGHARQPGVRWIWAAHCETSTGVLNDLDALREIAAATGARLCIDAISSIGTARADLRGVHLAACTSGKGLGSLPGLAIVLAGEAPLPAAGRLPRYLDLALWLSPDGVPFTHSSNLVAALDAALDAVEDEGRLPRIQRDSAWLRGELRARGLRVIAPEAAAAPGVATVEVPRGAPSTDVARALARSGYEVGARSGYLAERNWIQAALMGDYDRVALRGLPAAIAEAIRACSLDAMRAA